MRPVFTHVLQRVTLKAVGPVLILLAVLIAQRGDLGPYAGLVGGLALGVVLIMFQLGFGAEAARTALPPGALVAGVLSGAAAAGAGVAGPHLAAAPVLAGAGLAAAGLVQAGAFLAVSCGLALTYALFVARAADLTDETW